MQHSPVVIELVFIWIVSFLCLSKLSDAKWLMDIAAIFKAFILISLGVLGVYAACKYGVANNFSIRSMMPTFDSHSLSFLSVLIFNFMGFEVVASMAPEMDNPQKQIPKALALGGILIALFYMFGAFGMTVAIPIDQISPNAGLIESFQMLMPNGVFIIIIGMLFMFTLACNLISWSYGVNYVAASCASNGSLPNYFKKTNKNGSPVGMIVINGLIASVLVILSVFINNDVFWSFFALNVVTLLIAYLYMFLNINKTEI